ncbi:hypothetical protein ACGFIP_32175 [Micromonospora zamorensis]|uniref:hypothetical protein n=1 Tax=Micromonospora zamorensis TaxID=709883 RepID=UPI00371A3F3D
MKGPRFCDTFAPDPDLGTDHRGLSTCRNCHRVGKPGDPGHTPPPAPPAPKPKPQPAWIADAAAARDAAVLGEDDREEYR